MNEFLLIFRTSAEQPKQQLSPEEMQASIKPWQDWFGSLAAQDKLASGGNRLHPDGKTIQPNKTVTDGPYTEMKEAVGGYSIIKANSLDEAVELSMGCPILQSPWNGKVEVRMIAGMD